jgi:anti-sigma regulatory factor (Ser/Thr protein kinase)
MNAWLDVTVRHRGQVGMVHPRGSLTAKTATDLHRLLVTELLNTGRVVVDLDGFELGPQPSEVMIFPAALAKCGGWPAAKVALCRPDPQMTEALTALGVNSLVPVYHLLLEAQAEIDRRPDVVRRRTELPGNTLAPAMARHWVRDICPLWELDDELQHTAQVVVNELATMAVRHAGTTELILENGPNELRLAIRDTSLTAPPSRPQQYSIDPLQRQLGLRLKMLGNLTTAWGVDSASGGNTAWAVIAT